MARTQRRRLHREVARRWPELADAAADLIAAGAVVVEGIARTNPDMLVAASSFRELGDVGRHRREHKRLRSICAAAAVAAT